MELRALAEIEVVVERVWQLYSHDISEVRGTLPNSEALYKAGRLPTYFGDDDRPAYLIVREDAPSGLAFLQGLVTEPRMIGDFFVVRAARRQGVG